jgi:DNA-binding transcriptional ArsR family regulator
MRRDVFQAIADPTRREIIGLIAQQSLTPNAVANSFDVSRQAISKHIKILTECGLLELNIKGREYYYTMQPGKLAEVDQWLQPFREMWETRFGQLDKLLVKMQSKHKKKKT